MSCWCDAWCEWSAGSSAGKTASGKQSLGVRFSATQADGREGSDMVNARVAPLLSAAGKLGWLRWWQGGGNAG